MKSTAAGNFILTPRSDNIERFAPLKTPLAHFYPGVLCLEFQKDFSLSFVQYLFGMADKRPYSKPLPNHIFFVPSRSGDAWA